MIDGFDDWDAYLYDDDVMIASYSAPVAPASALKPRQQFDNEAWVFFDEQPMDDALELHTEMRLINAPPAAPPIVDGWQPWDDDQSFADDSLIETADSAPVRSAASVIVSRIPEDAYPHFDDQSFADDDLLDEYALIDSLPVVSQPVDDGWSWFDEDSSSDDLPDDNYQLIDAVVVAPPQPAEDAWDWFGDDTSFDDSDVILSGDTQISVAALPNPPEDSWPWFDETYDLDDSDISITEYQLIDAPAVMPWADDALHFDEPSYVDDDLIAYDSQPVASSVTLQPVEDAWDHFDHALQDDDYAAYLDSLPVASTVTSMPAEDAWPWFDEDISYGDDEQFTEFNNGLQIVTVPSLWVSAEFRVSPSLPGPSGIALYLPIWNAGATPSALVGYTTSTYGIYSLPPIIINGGASPPSGFVWATFGLFPSLPKLYGIPDTPGIFSNYGGAGGDTHHGHHTPVEQPKRPRIKAPKKPVTVNTIVPIAYISCTWVLYTRRPIIEGLIRSRPSKVQQGGDSPSLPSRSETSFLPLIRSK